MWLMHVMNFETVTDKLDKHDGKGALVALRKICEEIINWDADYLGVYADRIIRNFSSVMEEIDDVYDDIYVALEDVDMVLDTFYDYCDSNKIWVD